MEFSIRPAELSDREKIKPLQKEIADLHHEGRPDLFRTEARYYIEESFSDRMSKEGAVVYVAEHEGEIIGYVFANIIKYRDHPTYVDFDSFYIDEICVLEKYRRLGVGEALFNRCVEIAREQGCRNLFLQVYSFNTGAITFYERMGMHEMMKRMELTL